MLLVWCFVETRRCAGSDIIAVNLSRSFVKLYDSGFALDGHKLEGSFPKHVVEAVHAYWCNCWQFAQLFGLCGPSRAWNVSLSESEPFRCLFGLSGVDSEVKCSGSVQFGWRWMDAVGVGNGGEHQQYYCWCYPEALCPIVWDTGLQVLRLSSQRGGPWKDNRHYWFRDPDPCGSGCRWI